MTNNSYEKTIESFSNTYLFKKLIFGGFQQHELIIQVSVTRLVKSATSHLYW